MLLNGETFGQQNFLNLNYTFFKKQQDFGPSSQSCLIILDFQPPKFLESCLPQTVLIDGEGVINL